MRLARSPRDLRQGMSCGVERGLHFYLPIDGRTGMQARGHDSTSPSPCGLPWGPAGVVGGSQILRAVSPYLCDRIGGLGLVWYPGLYQTFRNTLRLCPRSPRTATVVSTAGKPDLYTVAEWTKQRQRRFLVRVQPEYLILSSVPEVARRCFQLPQLLILLERTK